MERRRLRRVAEKAEFEHMRVCQFEEYADATCRDLRELRRVRESRHNYDDIKCSFCENEPGEMLRTLRYERPKTDDSEVSAEKRTKVTGRKNKTSKAETERRRQEKQTSWLTRRLGSSYEALEHLEATLQTRQSPVMRRHVTLTAKGPLELEKERLDWMGTRSACNMEALLQESSRVRGY